MNSPETQRELLTHLDGITRRLGTDAVDISTFSTASIAEALSISRNLASQYLNDLVRTGAAVKAGARPVYYFHRRNLERYLQVRLDLQSYPTVKMLFSHRASENRSDFSRAIGYDLSLATCIERLRAAATYPPNGLPILLVGAPGTGKSILAKLLLEYGINEGILSHGSKLTVVDCSLWRDDVQGLGEAYHGSNGWASRCSGGILHLKNAELLSASAQDALIQWATEPPAPNKPGVAPSCSQPRLVFSTSAGRSSAGYRSLARHIPTTIDVPPLRQRSQEEREELTLHFLREEGRRMGADIFISRGAFRNLSSATFDENVRGLKQCVTNCCAEAYLNRSNERVEIRAYQLPPDILTGPAFERSESDAQLIDTMKDVDAQGDSRALAIMDEALAAYELEPDSADDEKLLKRIRELEDYLAFSPALSQSRATAYEHIADSAIDIVNGLYSTDLSHKTSHLVVQGICLQLAPPSDLSRWKGCHARELETMMKRVEHNHQFASAATTRLADEIEDSLGIRLDGLTRLLILAHIALTQSPDCRRSAVGVILAHGYSTATSLADAANRMLGSRVFEAIDMPYDQQVKDVIAPLQQVVDRFSYASELVILVDTGSLEDIYKSLSSAPGMTLGVINNVSTALAVEVGLGLIGRRSVKEILEQAASLCRFNFHVAEGRVQQDAIVFCAEGGLEAAGKIKELVAQSLSQEPPLRLVTREWRQLANNGANDSVFSSYHVRAIIGTDDPIVGCAPFIALDDLIAGTSTDKIDRAFAGALSANELELLHHNLIKNVTLRNVVESITILNPNKLFGEIERAVNRLQQLTQSGVGGRITVGLYVHLCCLVERLVTKSPIENYADEQHFASEHSDFVEAFRTSFADISSHYHVDVPVTEIAYAYDYINSRHAPRKHATQYEGPQAQQDE